jgi:hypothetical protein
MIVGSNAILINRASILQAVQRWLDATVMESVDLTHLTILQVDATHELTSGAPEDLIARIEFVPRPIAVEPDHDVADDIRAAITEQRALARAAFALDPALYAGLPPDCPIIPLAEPLTADTAAVVAAIQEANHG